MDYAYPLLKLAQPQQDGLDLRHKITMLYSIIGVRCILPWYVVESTVHEG